MSQTTGERLYEWVKTYAAFGDNRTGSPADLATTEWLADVTRALGAEVETCQFEFPCYDARWDITIDGGETQSLPLYYEAVGAVKSGQPYAGVAHLAHNPTLGAWGAGGLIEARTRGAEIAVLATTLGGDRLIVPNRVPELGEGPLAVLVPGHHAATLADAKIEVALEATIQPARATYVVAHFGRGARPFVVGTPTSGWFRCAGERGTGIAVAVELAARLAERCPVTFVGTSGHEISAWGLRAFLNRGQPTARATIHVGASIASGATGPGVAPTELSPNRTATTSTDRSTAAEIAAALAPIGLAPTVVPRAAATEARHWRGEAQLWCRVEAPLLSLAGSSPLFHTPEDIPEWATSPALLAHAYSAIYNAAVALVDGAEKLQKAG